MPIYWPSNTHRRARIWSSARNCRTIFVVYASASPLRPLDLKAKARTNQRLRRTRRGHGDVTPSSLPLGPGCPVMFSCDRLSHRNNGQRRRLGGAAVCAPPAGGPGGKLLEGAKMARTAALPILTAQSGLTPYLEEIRRFPLPGPQSEYTAAKRQPASGDTH